MAAVERRVVVHRQVAQPGVTGEELRLAPDRLQAVLQQQALDVVDLATQCRVVLGAHVEAHVGRHQAVAAGHLQFDLRGVLVREHRLGAVTDRGAFDVGDVRAQQVLRPAHQRHRHHSAHRQAVEHRIDLVANRAFRGQGADLGRTAQPLHRHDGVRHAVEAPQVRVGVGLGYRERQQLSEVAPEGQVPVTGVGRDIGQARAVAVADAGLGVEPLQQPVVDMFAIGDTG